MWIALAARGLGVGRRLQGELELTAGEAGVVVLRLETKGTPKRGNRTLQRFRLCRS